MSTYIPTIEIDQPSFHADELGFVFKWEGHLLRGIYPESVPQAKQYFESGFIKEITSKGLFPKTWISEFKNEQFGLIIEHELIQPVTYANEWNFQMLKDAALLVLEIAQIGEKYGYNMIDCHKLNIMFHHNRPVYVDLGSFVPALKGEYGWKPFNSFLKSYYYILDVWRLGAPQIAKRLMAPHVELSEMDYWCFKSILFRTFPSLLSLFLRSEKTLCRLVNVSDDKVKQYIDSSGFFIGRLLLFSKNIVSSCRLAPSLHLNHLARKIRKFNVTTHSHINSEPTNHEMIILDVLKNEFLDCRTATVINCEAFTFYESLLSETTINRLYSIQEEEPISRNEYNYYQLKGGNISCYNVIISGGEMLIRDKHPEDRLSSDIVLLPNFYISKGQFGIHNALIRLDLLMKYSSLKTIILTITNNQEFIESCQKHYKTKIISVNTHNNSNNRISCIVIDELH